MFQKMFLAGYLGADPELKYTSDGVPLCNFRIAVNRRGPLKPDGTRDEITMWFTITAWRALAETCGNYLKSGRLVLVEGTLNAPRPYLDSEGKPACRFEVTASDVRFMDRRADSTGDHAAVGETAAPADQDIPF